METSATATAQAPRQPNWSETEIAHMIGIWSDVDVQAAIDDPLTKNVKVYGRISKRMEKAGYNRTPAMVNNKIKQLKQKYKAVVDNNRRSGRARTTCAFFDELDRVLSKRPAINPPRGMVVESSEDTNANDGDESLVNTSVSSQEGVDSDGDRDMVSEDEGEATQNDRPLEGSEFGETQPEEADVQTESDAEADAEDQATQDLEHQLNPTREAAMTGKQRRASRAEKSLSMMLKTFMDSQDMKDKRFIAHQRQEAEAQKKAREADMAATNRLLEIQERESADRRQSDKVHQELMRSLLRAMSSPDCNRQPYQPAHFPSTGFQDNWTPSQPPSSSYPPQPLPTHALPHTEASNDAMSNAGASFTRPMHTRPSRTGLPRPGLPRPSSSGSNQSASNSAPSNDNVYFQL